MVTGLLQTTFVFLFMMYGLKFVGAGKSSVLLRSDALMEQPVGSEIFG